MHANANQQSTIERPAKRARDLRWRVVDIVVAAVIGVGSASGLTSASKPSKARQTLGGR